MLTTCHTLQRDSKREIVIPKNHVYVYEYIYYYYMKYIRWHKLGCAQKIKPREKKKKQK